MSVRKKGMSTINGIFTSLGLLFLLSSLRDRNPSSSNIYKSSMKVNAQQEIQHLCEEMEANLNINSADGFGSVTIPPEIRAMVVKGWNNTLVGILLSKQFWSVSEVDCYVKKKWSIRSNLETIQVVPGRYLFKFRFKDAMDKVFAGGPWTVHGFILLLQKWDPSINPEELMIPRQPFWVKLIGLDYEHLNHPMVKIIAGKIEAVLRIDPLEFMSLLNREIEVHVMVKVVGPLMQGVNIELLRGGVRRVNFLYLNRPEVYCTRCFKLDHKLIYCGERSVTQNTEGRIGREDYRVDPMRFQALPTTQGLAGAPVKVTKDFINRVGSSSVRVSVLPSVIVQERYDEHALYNSMLAAQEHELGKIRKGKRPRSDGLEMCATKEAHSNLGVWIEWGPTTKGIIINEPNPYVKAYQWKKEMVHNFKGKGPVENCCSMDSSSTHSAFSPYSVISPPTLNIITNPTQPNFIPFLL